MKSRRFLALVSLLAATALVQAAPEFDQWIEGFAQDWVRSDPMRATQAQYLPKADMDANDRLLVGPDGFYPIDASAIAARAALAQRGLQELKRFPLSELTPVQRVSSDMASWQLENTVQQTKAERSLYVFEQFGGVQVNLVNFLTQTHPIRNPRDVENYLARLEQVAPLLDRAIAEAKARAAQGVVPPRFILTSTLGGLERFLAPAPDQNVFVTALAERIGRLKDFPPAARDQAIARATQITADSVRPAYTRVRDLLTEQSKTATDDAGLWKLPHGDEIYATQLASFTTTSLTPDEIHAIGLKLVAETEAKMDKILRELGYTEGSVKDRYLKLNATLIPPESPEARPAIMAEYTRIVREAEVRAPAFFDLLPKAPIEVKREPAFTEAGSAAHYSPPAPDGSKPGYFFAPILNLTPDILWLGAGMKTVAYHEAVPGHHYQITLQQELPEVPRFRKFRILGGLSAFSEGWGLYAEQLADEAGWYDNDPQGRLGYLNAQLFRARRLVVDTGLHAKHWTRQQAIDYGIQASEVERYCVFPGQACSYMIGRLRIVELREKAKVALGAKFSLKEYHNLLLKTGTVPLDVLTQVVDEWISSEKSQAPKVQTPTKAE
jgi:uncharacterized protein (DUF885 family)